MLDYQQHERFGVYYLRPTPALYRDRDPNAHPDRGKAQKFIDDHSRRIEIKFVGVWDTVGSLGIPLRGLRSLTYRRHRFQDMKLSSIVRYAYQALAIDERRAPFNLDFPDRPKW